MPIISTFYGIIITMNWDEHNPPHFHARYAGKKAMFSILNLSIMEGNLDRRATALILEWAFLHRDKLKENWELVMTNQMPNPITPLE